MSESSEGTTGHRIVVHNCGTIQTPETCERCERILSGRNDFAEEKQTENATRNRTRFMKTAMEKVAIMMKVEGLDEETSQMVERVIVVRLSPKHINLWMRQLEMKRKAIG